MSPAPLDRVVMSMMIYSASYARISEQGILQFLNYVIGSNPFAHSAMHAIHTTLLYLAIEPYVRRIWPRALIGWARLSRGRWRDPSVGREVLIGMNVSLVANTFIWADHLRRILRGQPAIGLLGIASDMAELLGGFPLAVAVSLYFSMIVYFILLVLRLITRRDWATVVLVASLPIAVTIYLLTTAESPRNGILVVGTGITIFTTCIALLVIRAGLLATMTFSLVSMFWFAVPMTFDMSAFYAHQTILGAIFLVALAAFGLRTSLAGQPVLRGILGDPR